MRTAFLSLVLFFLLVPAIPVQAAGDAAGAPKGASRQADDRQVMSAGHSEMKQAMMHNPNHLMAMAYHKNLVNFAMALQRVARQGDTVPRDFARSAITEMRRSAVQLEVYHDEAVKGLPPELREKHAGMAKGMRTHLEQMNQELVQLETLAKTDRIGSRDLLPHLDALLKGCQGMCHQAGMCHEGKTGGMYGKGRHHGGHGGCADCGNCQEGGAGMPGCRDMKQQRQQMMHEMREQDAQISGLVQKMNGTAGAQQQAIMADILTRIVHQREAMAAHMVQMQGHPGLHGRTGAPCMQSRDRGDDDDDADFEGGSGEGMENRDFEPNDSDSDDDGRDMDETGSPH